MKTDNSSIVLDTNLHWGMPARVARPDMEKWFGKQFDSSIRMVELMCSLEDNPSVPAGFSLDDLSEKQTCHHCGERFAYKRISKDHYRAGDAPCALPGGMPVYEVLLNVPSGRIVFANDLRPICEIADEDAHHDIQTHVGMRKTVEAYARHGMAHIYMGNSCPSVWKQDGRLAVANYRTPGVDDEDDDFPLEGVITPVAEQGECVDSICTDLWWYSAMDHDEFKARCAAEGYDEAMADFIVEVVPGTYAFSVEQVQRDTASEVFSYIRRTDAAAPPLVRLETGVASSLEQSLAWKAVTRYGGHYLLCVNGNGYDWSKGILTSGGRGRSTPFHKLDENSPIDHPLAGIVPLLPFPMAEGSAIYPLAYGFSSILRIPVDIDPWWLAFCLLFATATAGSLRPFEGKYGYDPAKQQRIMQQALYELLEVTEARGGESFIRPYLTAWADSEVKLP